MDISKNFDRLLKETLSKRLGRKPLRHEIINADNDADLVNEILWQIIYSFNDRLAILEKNAGVVTPNDITPPPDAT